MCHSVGLCQRSLVGNPGGAQSDHRQPEVSQLPNDRANGTRAGRVRNILGTSIVQVRPITTLDVAAEAPPAKWDALQYAAKYGLGIKAKPGVVQR